ncbi:MAG: DUF6067 family protein, partial [Cyclobacteriaceae bacterium]
MKKFSLLTLSLFSFFHCFSQDSIFSVCENCWDADSLGNHRAVVQVNSKSDVVKVTIPWRRRDVKPEAKDILVQTETGKLISNVSRGLINREVGEIFFEPIEGAGKYYVYYLKHVTVGRSNYPTVNYPPFQSNANDEWLKKLKSATTAQVISIQSIDELNSFYPMEVIATQEELKALKAKSNGSYMVFPEDRMHPIKMLHDVPYRWIERGVPTSFSDQAARGENFAYQLGVYASNKVVNNVVIEFSDLKSKSGDVISKEVMSCLNTSGIGWDGKPFKKIVNIAKGDVQALWCMINIPDETRAGTYIGSIKVNIDDNEPTNVSIQLKIKDEVLTDGGVSEPWKQTRLTWLNSTLGTGDEVIAPYIPLELKNQTISFLGRSITLDGYGLPGQITSFFDRKMTSIIDRK